MKRIYYFNFINFQINNFVRTLIAAIVAVSKTIVFETKVFSKAQNHFLHVSKSHNTISLTKSHKGRF